MEIRAGSWYFPKSAGDDLAQQVKEIRLVRNVEVIENDAGRMVTMVNMVDIEAVEADRFAEQYEQVYLDLLIDKVRQLEMAAGQRLKDARAEYAKIAAILGAVDAILRDLYANNDGTLLPSQSGPEKHAGDNE